VQLHAETAILAHEVPLVALAGTAARPPGPDPHRLEGTSPEEGGVLLRPVLAQFHNQGRGLHLPEGRGRPSVENPLADVDATRPVLGSQGRDQGPDRLRVGKEALCLPEVENRSQTVMAIPMVTAVRSTT